MIPRSPRVRFYLWTFVGIPALTFGIGLVGALIWNPLGFLGLAGFLYGLTRTARVKCECGEPVALVSSMFGIPLIFSAFIRGKCVNCGRKL